MLRSAPPPPANDDDVSMLEDAREDGAGNDGRANLQLLGHGVGGPPQSLSPSYSASQRWRATSYSESIPEPAPDSPVPPGRHMYESESDSGDMFAGSASGGGPGPAAAIEQQEGSESDTTLAEALEALRGHNS